MEALKKIWHDPVWSKVIAAAIVAVVAVMAGYVLNWWPKVGAVLLQTTLVPNWLLGLLALGTALTVLLVVVVVCAGIRQDESLKPEWNSYSTDNFFGLRWRWRYLDGGQPFNIVAFCPRCDLQLHPQQGSGYQATDRIAFRCESCGQFGIELEESESSLEDKTARFIQQKIRNGQWREHVQT